jgi:dipeptidyl aminopeptidase/acylaminoacyl peptidase
MKPTVRLASLILVAAALLLAPVSPVRAQGLLTPTLAVELERVTDVAVADGGERIAYVVSVPRAADDEPGGAFAEIWVCNADGTGHRQLTASGLRSSSPRWSPDGSRLAFVSKRERVHEQAQILVMPVDGGEPRALTRHEAAVGDFAWSPDGGSIAFAATDAKGQQREDDEEVGRDWTVVGEQPRHRRLWMLDVATGATRPLYDEALSVLDFAWSPDGRTLVMRAADTPDTDDGMMAGSLYTIDRESGTPRRIAATAGKLGSMAVSPDGRQLAFCGATSLNDPLAQSLFVVDMAGGSPRNLTADLEASMSQVAWLDDRRVLALADRGVRTVLLRIDVGTGRIAEAMNPGPVVGSFAYDGRSRRLAVTASATDHPSELFVADGPQGNLQRVTSRNPALEELRLAREEEIAWTSTDGMRIAGVLTHPVGPGAGPHPLIVNPHGGPEGVSQLGFNTLPQLLAARGYLVLQPNYRGSGGRGVAFSKGDHDDLGGQEFQDILSGIDALVERGLADADRVGIGGWSYGGYLSALAGTHHSPRFKAAVMGAGISNWVSFMGTTDIPREMSIVHWNFFWRENPALYWMRSPLSAINDAATPMLILHGARDDRVPPGQAHEMHVALRQVGVPTQLVLYPRAAHGISERAHRIDLYQRQLDWFDRHVR